MISKTYLSLLPSDLATYGRDAKSSFEGIAEPERENVFGDIPRFEHRAHRAGVGKQRFSGIQYCTEAQLQPVQTGLPTGAGADEQPAAGRLPDRDPARSDHQQHGDFCAVYHTGAVRQSAKESLYYGLNALSNNLIMVDRKKLKNPNGLILGTPGSGKSPSAQSVRSANAFLVTDDDIII